MSDQLALRADMCQCRKHLLTIQKAEHAWTPDTVADKFSHWVITDGQQFLVLPHLLEHLHCSRWSSSFSDLVIQWTQTLVWPPPNAGCTTSPGISWFELAVNFMLTTPRSIPFFHNGQMIDQDSHEAWTRDQCDMNTLLANLMNCIAHLEYLF